MQLIAESTEVSPHSVVARPAPAPTSAILPRPLVLILVLGGICRLLLWVWFEGSPLQVWDERDYDLLAKNIVTYGEFSFTPGTPISLRPPLYPAFVAGIYTIFGLESFQAVRLIQGILGLITTWIVYRLGARVHSTRLGICAAGLYCFYPSLLGQANLLLTETLFTLLLCLSCDLLVALYQTKKLRYAAAAGVVVGLAALTRSILWLSPPCIILYLLVTWPERLRRRCLAAALLVATFALTLAPWAIRNTRLQETFVAVDTMGGRNFMMGNYEHTPLYRSWDAISIKGDKSWDHEVNANFPAELPRTQGYVDKVAFRQGIKFVKEHPWLTLERDVIKFFDFWGLEREILSGLGNGWWGNVSSLAILSLGTIILGAYVAILFLGIFGVILRPLPDRRIHWLLLSVIVYICGIHTLVFGHSRYHLPLMPLVMLFAASAILHAREIWQRRGSWSFLSAAAVCFVFVGSWIWSLAAGDLDKLSAIFRVAT